MTDYMGLMRSRHSVRRYLDKPIPADLREKLDAYAGELNRKSGLSIQIIYDEPECFGSARAKYGSFEGCSNYICLVGKSRERDLDERCGYYGEMLVLRAQELGLNTCWVALTHGKTKAVVAKGEKEVIVVSLGYGADGGRPRKSKSPGDVCRDDGELPVWYSRGIEAALLAPTAINQQKFRFSRAGNRVSLEPGKLGPCLLIDLGIVRLHFELGAGRENFVWENRADLS